VSTASRSKSVAFAFLLGAFLTGGASGFAAGRTTAPERAEKPYTRQYDERSMRRELARELSLSPAQQAAFDSIFDWRRRRYREVMAPIQPGLDSARDSARTLMVQQLDETQRQAFTDMLDRMRRQSDSARRARRQER
jgi:hypothetical protein